MEQNKVRNYLLYAIGEIFLVMIGILLALQVNTFQANKTNQEIEVKVLEKLKQDLLKDTKDLDRLLAIKQDQLIASHYMLELFQDPNQALSDPPFDYEHIFLPFHYYVDNPHRTAFETAVNSGELFLITNDALLEVLSFYFSDNNLSQFLLTTKEFSIHYYHNVLIRKYEIQEAQAFHKQNLPSFYKDTEIKNYYFVMANNHLTIGSDLIDRKLSINSMLRSLIDHELNVNTLSKTQIEHYYSEIHTANSRF